MLNYYSSLDKFKVDETQNGSLDDYENHLRYRSKQLIMISLKKYSKHMGVGMILIALSGIIFPLVNINLHLIGTISISLGLTDMFRNFSGDFFRGAFDLATSDNLLSDAGMNIILPFGAYMLAIILIILTLILTFTNKFKVLKIVFVLTATTLMIYVGIRLIAMPDTLIYSLEEILADFIGGFSGFLTNMVDFSHVLEINLGLGYWITLSTLIILLIFLIVIQIIEHMQKKVSD